LYALPYALINSFRSFLNLC